MGEFASSKNTIAECDICGFQYKLRKLRRLVIKNIETDLKACEECWNPSQPQLMLGTFPVHDPQAVRDPRPDFAGYPQSRDIQWGWNPVGLDDPFNLTPDNLEATGAVGQVTVTTT
jgi:hypothetical protein